MLNVYVKLLLYTSAAIQMSCGAQQYDTRGPGRACAGGDAARNNMSVYFTLLNY